MPVSLITPSDVAARAPFDASVDVSGAPPGEPITVTLRAEDDPSFSPREAEAVSSPTGEVRVLLTGLILNAAGRRALVATAKDGLDLPLGTDVAFIEVR
ncbi:MAG: hypothetical protein H6741_28995 [Alphaproteobacteria bacterium]|nr:hypothetical protein [Alphaproteobacteria bacterium]